jgi:hypothetical protein
MYLSWIKLYIFNWVRSYAFYLHWLDFICNVGLGWKHEGSTKILHTLRKESCAFWNIFFCLFYYLELSGQFLSCLATVTITDDRAAHYTFSHEVLEFATPADSYQWFHFSRLTEGFELSTYGSSDLCATVLTIIPRWRISV